MEYFVSSYGADPSGKNLSTAAIQAAIDACAENGGGCVTVPNGTYVIGTLWLKSHVELYLEQGAVLKASTNMDDYNELDAYPQNYSWLPEEWVGKHLIITVGETVQIKAESSRGGEVSWTTDDTDVIELKGNRGILVHVNVRKRGDNACAAVALHKERKKSLGGRTAKLGV